MFSITDEELQVFDNIVGKLQNFEGILSEFHNDAMLLDLFIMKVHTLQYFDHVVADVHSSRQVPGLTHHLKKQKKAAKEEEDAQDSDNDDTVNEILAQWNSEVDEHIVRDIFFIDTGLMDVQDSGR